MANEDKALTNLLDDVNSDPFHFIVKYGVSTMIQVMTIHIEDYKEEKINGIAQRCNGEFDKATVDGRLFGFVDSDDAESFVKLVNNTVETGAAYF